MRSCARSSSIAVVLLIVSLAHAGAVGQQPTATRAAGWVVPRTADGQPDLEGVWENNSATPLERPAQFAQKPRLSDEELATLERRASRLFGPEAEAVFGDALYPTLLADTKPAGLGRDRLLQSELASRSILRAPDFVDCRSCGRETAADDRRGASGHARRCEDLARSPIRSKA